MDFSQDRRPKFCGSLVAYSARHGQDVENVKKMFWKLVFVKKNVSLHADFDVEQNTSLRQLTFWLHISQNGLCANVHSPDF